MGSLEAALAKHSALSSYCDENHSKLSEDVELLKEACERAEGELMEARERVETLEEECRDLTTRCAQYERLKEARKRQESHYKKLTRDYDMLLKEKVKFEIF